MSTGEERQLWCAVIHQAIEDARLPLGPNRSRNTDTLRARDWLTRPNQGFTDVCAAAGYEPSRIRAQAIKIIAAVTPSDCPPLPQPRKQRAPRIRKTTNEGPQANVP